MRKKSVYRKERKICFLVSGLIGTEVDKIRPIIRPSSSKHNVPEKKRSSHLRTRLAAVLQK